MHKREQVLGNIEEFVSQELQSPSLAKEVNYLRHDWFDDQQRVAIVGEFKRGKSTLVNALLQRSIMPVDILPTTGVVHKVRHSEQEQVHVYYQNDVETVPLNKTLLDQFTIDHDIKDIDSIMVETDLSHLSTDIELLDTPGVGDLNDLSLKVTYEQIPRADLIVFVLDLTTPLRQSEINYLIDTIQPLAMGDVMFVANFADRVDEDEIDELTEYLEKKLKSITEQDITVLPISALDATEVDDDDWNNFVNTMLSRLENQNHYRADLLEKRENYLINMIQKHVSHVETLQQAEQEELESLLNAIKKLEGEEPLQRKRFEEYVKEREKEIKRLTHRSIETFSLNLNDKLLEEINQFDGGDLKRFVEKDLTRIVEQESKKWFNHHIPHIQQLIQKVELELFEGIKRTVSNKQGDMRQGSGLDDFDEQLWDVQFSYKQAKIKDSVKDHMTSLGASGIAVGIGAAILGPLSAIFLGASPLLKDYLSNKRIKQFQEEAPEKIEPQMKELKEKIEDSLDEYIHNQLNDLLHNTTSYYRDVLLESKESIEQQILINENHHQYSHIDLQQWPSLLAALEGVRNGSSVTYS
ncbi:GTPase Era involved in 16S rRNA processing/DNA-binding transcriptional MerR regulator [Alkalibacillus flavidus]|uniref:GTPase Era involved in 16S rRNA processing/DNA-binding transcriptional MerR regulator n=1 Tax=Alkalibacillus flavidus TaxID=546021 RepID=A0ABV2KXX8_9BACI